MSAHHTQALSNRRGATATHAPSCAVIGPDGQIFTPGDLPRKAPRRWVARRKAEVTIAVLNGLISLPDLRDRYGLSFGEVLQWTVAYQETGLTGLQTLRRPKR